MIEFRDLRGKELFLNLYDGVWIIEGIKGLVKSVTYSDGTNLEHKHYLLLLDSANYSAANEAVLWGRVRRYDPNSKDVVISDTEKRVKIDFKEL